MLAASQPSKSVQRAQSEQKAWQATHVMQQHLNNFRLPENCVYAGRYVCVVSMCVCPMGCMSYVPRVCVCVCLYAAA